MSLSPARRLGFTRGARAVGRRWRSYAALVAIAACATVAIILFPRLSLRAGDLGLVLGMIGLLVIGSMIATTTPAVDGRLAGQWDAAGLRKVRGWGVIDDVPVDRQQIAHLVVTPAGVLAVETTSRAGTAGDDRLEVERHLSELTSAEFAAHKVRLFLREQGRRDATVVIPVLLVSGPRAADLPDGHRIDNGVHVVDGTRPEQWTHLFNGPRLMASTRRDLYSLFTALAAKQAKRIREQAKLQAKQPVGSAAPTLRHDLWHELRAGVADERAHRRTCEGQARTAPVTDPSLAGIPGATAVPAAAPVAVPAAPAGG